MLLLISLTLGLEGHGGLIDDCKTGGDFVVWDEHGHSFLPDLEAALDSVELGMVQTSCGEMGQPWSLVCPSFLLQDRLYLAGGQNGCPTKPNY